MSLTAFPEPKDLDVRFVDRIGDSRPKSFQEYNVSNPHPGFGKDPNILNEFGHTKYPMFVGNVKVNNEEEEKAARGEASVPQVAVNNSNNTTPVVATSAWPSAK